VRYGLAIVIAAASAITACADSDRVVLAGRVEVVGELGSASGAPVALLFYERASGDDAGCAGAWLACPSAWTQAVVVDEAPARVTEDRREHDFALHAWRRGEDVRQDVGAFLDLDGDGRLGPAEPVGDDPDNPARSAREIDCGPSVGSCIPIEVTISL
jgi:hypothetical protein